MKKHLPGLLIILTAAMPLHGQETFGGPVPGHFFDGAQIRPISGTPGAAYLGSAPHFRWDHAAVSPNGKMALGVRRNTVDLVPDIASQGRAASLTGAISGPDRIVWSMDSTTAVLYSSKSRLMQRVTGLGNSPALHTPIDLSFAGTLSGWSLSPDGRSIAVAGGASVYLLVDDGSPAPVGSFADPGVSSFSSDSKFLFVLDRAVQRIVRLKIADLTVQGFLDVSSLPATTSLQSSPDGSLLYVAGAQLLSAFDSSSLQPVWSRPLDIAPDSMTALSISPPVFLLNYQRQNDSPVWLLDGRTNQVYFVPSGGAAGYAAR